NRFLLQLYGGGSYQNQFTDVVVNFHYFVEAAAALVTAVVAHRASTAFAHFYPLRLVGSEPSFDQGLYWQVEFLASVFADATHQALGNDHVDRSGYQEWLNAHVHQAADGFWSAVGVQCGEHQVAGEGGLDGNFRGFEVADLAHQNDVGVLPQKRAQRR